MVSEGKEGTVALAVRDSGEGEQRAQPHRGQQHQIKGTRPILEFEPDLME
jgi:hypothetical protein